MLKLKDFIHLPVLDRSIRTILGDQRSMILVCGRDARSPQARPAADAFLPGGRSTITGILFHEMLDTYPGMNATLVVRNKSSIHFSGQLKNRVRVLIPNPPYTYSGRIIDAQQDQSNLLVVDKLDLETVSAIFDTAQTGKQVLTQFDSILRGSYVIDHLIDRGANPDQLTTPIWVIAVKRLQTLCSECKLPLDPDTPSLKSLHRLDLPEEIRSDIERATFYSQGSCPLCQYTGRSGDMLGFDIFRYDPTYPPESRGASQLGMEAYLIGLATRGFLTIEDAINFDRNLLSTTYTALNHAEDALADASSQVTGKMAELEAANRVLVKRTEVLVSLETFTRELISSVNLNDLAVKVCKYACDLCGADLAILYYRSESSSEAKVLAHKGWDPARITKVLDDREVFHKSFDLHPKPFREIPPGVIAAPSDNESKPTVRILGGIQLPLMAQNRLVGLMVVQSTRKELFQPSEVALLQTFGNQAALAIQRAGLIDELQGKIFELERAQSELVKKERLEKELEMARDVQQSVIPKTFPVIPGYDFGALYHPARLVGGDFYDVIQLDASHFGILMADVSDKGMPAALYMALTRSLILAEGHRNYSPKIVLQNVNTLLKELGEANMFVSVFYGVVDITTHTLAYTRAGHEYPILLRDVPIELIGGQGLVLGVLDGEDFSLPEETIDLRSGDRLVLYTDGLIDVFDANHQLQDREKLKTLLVNYAGLPPVEMTKRVFDRLILHQGTVEQYDDMAILVMDISERAGSAGSLLPL